MMKTTENEVSPDSSVRPSYIISNKSASESITSFLFQFCYRSLSVSHLFENQAFFSLFVFTYIKISFNK